MNDNGSPIFTTGTADPPARKKSRRGLIIIAAIAGVIAGAATAAVVFLPGYYNGTKVGNANNGGPGEILIMTATKNGESAEGKSTESRYRIGTDGVLYQAPGVEFTFADEGLSAIPLSCARTAFYGKASDGALCDNDSGDPERFGAAFFSELRYALYDAFDEADLARKLLLRRIFKSNGRVFLSLIVVGGSNGGNNILMEYKDRALMEVTTFLQETVRWVETAEGGK